MADLENIMSVASADIHSILGVARADISTVMGVTMPSLSDWKGATTFYIGGRFINSSGSYSNNETDQITYKNMTTDGNTGNFADLTSATYNPLSSGSNGTRILVMGGNRNTKDPAENNNVDQVTTEYFVAASAGTNALDAGDLPDGGNRGGGSGSSNGTLCFAYGGERYPGEGSPGFSRDQIDYQNISTTGGATDGGGNLTAASYGHEKSNHDTKALILNIDTNAYGSANANIDQHNFSTSANATDWGYNCTKGVGYGTGVMCSTTRVVFGGGQVEDYTPHNEVHYVTVDSASDSTDAANLFDDRVGSGLVGTSDGTRGEIYGGDSADSGNGGSGAFIRETIQKFTLASLGDGADIGNLVNEDRDGAHTYGEAGGLISGCAQTA